MGNIGQMKKLRTILPKLGKDEKLIVFVEGPLSDMEVGFYFTGLPFFKSSCPYRV
jgi:hypothetical protein